MEPQTPTERMIQEYVPGKQVTLAHLIANPGKDLFKKLGLPDAVSAIGILTITPGGDRFSRSLHRRGGVDRRCLRRGVRAQAGHPHPR